MTEPTPRLTAEHLAEIWARLAAITGTPWRIGEDSDRYAESTVENDCGDTIASAWDRFEEVAFIANAPDDIDVLLREAEKLTTERDNALMDVRGWKLRVDEAADVVGELEAQVETQRAALVVAQTALAYEGVRGAEVDAIVGTEGLPSWMGGKEESGC